MSREKLIHLSLSSEGQWLLKTSLYYSINSRTSDSMHCWGLAPCNNCVWKIFTRLCLYVPDRDHRLVPGGPAWPASVSCHRADHWPQSREQMCDSVTMIQSSHPSHAPDCYLQLPGNNQISVIVDLQIFHTFSSDCIKYDARYAFVRHKIIIYLFYFKRTVWPHQRHC